MNNADSGPGSLRAALADASSGDTIDFDDSLRGQTITLTSGELALRTDLDIEGPGAADLTVSGNHASRVFSIVDRFTVAISGLTIADGFDPGAGGGIYNGNGGTLTLTGSTLSGNSASGGVRARAETSSTS
jgi:hypothetical protein